MATSAEGILTELVDIFEREIITEEFPPKDWRVGYGAFLDFEQYKSLKQYKETLPISIQRIIEWAQQLIVHNKVNNIDFDEIDKDLKYQHQQCNGDKMKLKRIYFNWDSKMKEDEYNQHNLMFYDTCYTVTHFIFYMFTGKKYNKWIDRAPYLDIDKNKRVLIGLKLLKLFIQNDIINVNNNIRGSYYSIYDILNGITSCMMREVRTYNEIIHNVPYFIDVIMASIDQKFGNEEDWNYCV